jgi:hypothetical protein
MRLIVPLAGPDFVSKDGTLKALIPFKGKPILKYILESRPWVHDLDAITFILNDTPTTRQFASNYLSEWFPNSLTVFISTFSRGAAFSSLAGISCQSEFDTPIIVDLADIFYKSIIQPTEIFSASRTCGGIGLVFSSNNPLYSYLRCDSSGKFCEAAEKKVISHYASVGTYIFKNSAVFLRALAHAIDNESDQTHNDLFYLCPLFNGVLDQGLDISMETVDEVIDIKLLAANT